MRPASRIAPLLARLRRAWEACPDMRLGQIAVNASQSQVYSIEDEALVAAIEAACPSGPGVFDADAVEGLDTARDAYLAAAIDAIPRQTAALERIANALEGKGRVVPCSPDVTPKGRSCGLCDSTAGCSHPRSRCTRCDAYGLAENMVRHECAGKPGLL